MTATYQILTFPKVTKHPIKQVFYFPVSGTLYIYRTNGNRHVYNPRLALLKKLLSMCVKATWGELYIPANLKSADPYRMA